MLILWVRFGNSLETLLKSLENLKVSNSVSLQQEPLFFVRLLHSFITISSKFLHNFTISSGFRKRWWLNFKKRKIFFRFDYNCSSVWISVLMKALLQTLWKFDQTDPLLQLDLLARPKLWFQSLDSKRSSSRLPKPALGLIRDSTLCFLYL